MVGLGRSIRRMELRRPDRMTRDHNLVGLLISIAIADFSSSSFTFRGTKGIFST